MANTLKYRGYHGQIEFSAEDNLFVGHVEMCKTFGREPDKECKGSFNVRISPPLHRSAAIQAEAEGKSLNQFIQEAIEEKLSPGQEIVAIMIDRQETLVSAGSPVFPDDTQSRYQPSIPVS